MVQLPPPLSNPLASQGTLSVSSTRPQDPRNGTIWINPDTGDIEQWNGFEWVKLTRLSQIIPSFGDGSDGDVVLTGNTTLTRDMFYNNLNIGSGVVLNPNGYRIFVRETMSGSGVIRSNGGDGENGKNYVDGLPVPIEGGARGAHAHGTGYLGGCAASGRGGDGDGDGTQTGDEVPGNGTSVTQSLGSTGSRGGKGGGPWTGGLAGVATPPVANEYGIGDIQQIIRWRVFPVGGTVVSFKKSAGSGGGGGGHWNGSNLDGGGGGGGGAPGGTALIVAAIITGSWTIECIGGDGGDGGDGAYGSGGNDPGASGGGGGGGGSGSVIYVIYSEDQDWTGSIDVSGGIGGLAGIGGLGSGTGSDGSDGEDGTDGNPGASTLISTT